MLRPGFEETEENLTNLMESRLQDHERIRGGLYFIQEIPRDENWKVRRDALVEYEPKTMQEVKMISFPTSFFLCGIDVASLALVHITILIMPKTFR